MYKCLTTDMKSWMSGYGVYSNYGLGRLLVYKTTK
jgi:hypothetical protein